jgi:cell division protease FtsH
MTDGKTFTTYAPDDPGCGAPQWRKNVSIHGQSPRTSLHGTCPHSSRDPHALAHRRLDPVHAPDADGRHLGHEFRQEQARLMTQDRMKVTFSDVAGVDEARKSWRRSLSSSRNPSASHRWAAAIPKGVLLLGPPGIPEDPARQGRGRRSGGTYRSSARSGSDFVGCSWASAPPGCATCSPRASSTRRA